MKKWLITGMANSKSYLGHYVMACFNTRLYPPTQLSNIKPVFLLSLLIVALISFWLWTVAPRLEGDTAALIYGTSRAIDCQNQHVWPCSGVVHFPLYQYIPTAILLLAGLDFQKAHSALASVNLIFFFSSLSLFYVFTLRVANRASAILVLAVLLTGYNIYYAYSSFNEMAAFFWFSTLVIACVNGWHWLIVFVVALIAGITKEISPPFVIGVALIAHFKGRFDELPHWALRLLPAVTGALCAFTVNIGFNLFRFGVWFNQENLAPNFIVPNTYYSADFLLAILFSPNGGLLWAWMSWCILFCVLIASALDQAFGSWRSRALRLFPAISVLLLFLILHIGLARWWSPFGWGAWGPRLTLPYLGAFLLLLCWHYREALRSIGNWVAASRDRQLLIGIVCSLLALPHVLILLEPDKMFNVMFSPTSISAATGLKPPQLNPTIENFAQIWPLTYLATRELCWIRPSIFLHSFHLLNQSGILFRWLIYSLLICSVFLSVRYKCDDKIIRSDTSRLNRLAWLLIIAIVVVAGVWVTLLERRSGDFQARFIPSERVDFVGKNRTLCSNGELDLVFSLKMDRKGLIQSISIENRSGMPFGLTTDPSKGQWLLGVAMADHPNELINAFDGSIEIPIDRPRDLLLYGSDNGALRSGKALLDAIVIYSDGWKSVRPIIIP